MGGLQNLKSLGNSRDLAELSQQLGTAELDTKAQNISEAINEIKAIEAAAAGIDDEQVSSVLTWSSDKVNTDRNLTGDIKGTTQSITYNTDGTAQKITHKNSDDVTIREDVFTYEDSLITEVRTLTGGGAITYKYHLDTGETEVI